MKRLWMSGAAAVMAISIAGVGAQTPQQPPTTPPPTTQPPTAQQPAEAQNMQAKTIQGCVYKENAIPGRTPNPVERAGVLEDYILVASEDTKATGTTGTTGTTPPPATRTPGAAMSGHKAFKLEKIDDNRLQAMVGKRVEVTGKVDAERDDTRGVGTTGAPAKDKTVGSPDEIELPEFEVTSIREVEGTCPATPNIRK